jgi:hypothetical protein
MKKPKKPQDFFFKDLEKDELVSQIDRDLPLNLKKLEPFIERIYNRYPLISKPQIVIIVKATLQAIRELLLLGYVLNIHRFVFDMKMLFFTHTEKQTYPAVKVKLTTPPALRIKDNE